ncbi:MAG: AAA family ATPase [Flexistipes sinusarabici]|uniref:AAA family ATPase n=1 Tax=Flexistipes sinusarabici TaxID=2352 RepID=A0A5D0MGW5_FLESI|nr:AAA family ATPase [Flexistipes sinusarabici]TYB32927.1 MAG: AAA family ATPase [Flexistipes sinusarabici]
MKTYLEKIEIDQCGILHNKTLHLSPDKINLIYGDNESGKSTLLELIRYGFYEVGKKHKINDFTDKYAEIYLSCLSQPFKVTLTDKKRTISPNDSVLSSLSENVSRENYENIFAFGQEELFNIRYKDIFGREKNAILTATGIDLDTDLNKIQNGLRKSYENLYKPKGRIPVINSYIAELRKLQKDSKKIAAKLKENEDIFQDLENIQSELNNRKKMIEKCRDDLHELGKLLQPFDTYSDIKEKEAELDSLKKSKKIDRKTFSEIQEKRNEINALLNRIEEIENRQAETEEEMKQIENKSNKINLDTAKDLLKQLEANLNVYEEESEIIRKYEKASDTLNNIKEKLNMNELYDGILKEDVTNRLVGINSEYQKVIMQIEHTEMLLKNKKESLDIDEDKANNLLNTYETNFREIEKDHDIYEKALGKLNSHTEKIKKIKEGIAGLQSEIKEYDSGLHNFLLENKNLFEKIKEAAEFENDYEKIAHCEEKIENGLKKTKDFSFPNNIKFTAIGILMFSLLTGITNNFIFLFVIPFAALADIIPYLYNRKSKKEIKKEAVKISEIFGFKEKEPHEVLNNLQKLKGEISLLISFKKELAKKGVRYENFNETLKLLNEKKSETEANRATINKLNFDKKMLESEITDAKKNINDIMDKYGIDNENGLSGFFNKAKDNFETYNRLTNEIKTLESDIRDLTRQIKTSKDRISSLSDNLEKFLETNGLEKISIDKVNYLLSVRQEIRQSLEDIKEYKLKKKTFENTKAFLTKSLKQMGIDTDNLKDAYAELKRLTNKEEELVQELSNLARQSENYSKESAVNKNKLTMNEKEYKKLLQNNNLDDFFDAENALLNYQNYRELLNKFSNNEELFHKKYGFSVKRYEEILNKESYASMKQKAEDKQMEMDNLNDDVARLSADEARTKEIISNLAESTDLMENEKQENYYSRKISEHLKEYVTYKTAETILEKSIKRFEEESQPELLDRASNFFNILTKGKYEKIKIDITGNLNLVDRNRNSFEANILSAGTKDQLYISLRLAYIQMLDKKFILPLIFDETIVNFDDKRQDAFLNTLSDITGSRQTIFFTCHSAVKEKFLSKFNELNLQELTQ